MQEKSSKKSIIKQNILQIIEIEGITKYEFYKRTRITRGVLDQNNGMSEENIARFLACYPEIDANWLITGEGSMYRTNDAVKGSSPPDRDDIIQLLHAKIEDQQKIIELLEDKVELLQGGRAGDGDNMPAAAAG